MRRGIFVAAWFAVLLYSALASAEVTPFSYPLTEDDVVGSAWLRVYEESNPTGTPLLVMSASSPGHGQISGWVNRSGTTINRIAITGLSFVFDDTVDVVGYVEGTKVEVIANNITLSGGDPCSMPVNSSHHFGTTGFYFFPMNILNPTTGSLTLNDLFTFNFSASDLHMWYSSISGYATMIGNQPAISFNYRGAGGPFSMGGYLFEVYFNIDPLIIPEPATLSAMALGGLVLLRRRRDRRAGPSGRSGISVRCGSVRSSA